VTICVVVVVVQLSKRVHSLLKFLFSEVPCWVAFSACADVCWFGILCVDCCCVDYKISLWLLCRVWIICRLLLCRLYNFFVVVVRSLDYMLIVVV
jgi:hypothetical protein